MCEELDDERLVSLQSRSGIPARCRASRGTLPGRHPATLDRAAAGRVVHFSASCLATGGSRNQVIMVPPTPGGSPDTGAPLQRAADGDARAWGALLTEHEGRLRRMVAFRMDPRLRGRVDAADVVQEAYVEAAEHRGDYFRFATVGAAPGVPVFLWLRGMVGNKLLEVHRHHLGTRMRDAAREAGARAAARRPRPGRHVRGPGRPIERPRDGPGDGGGPVGGQGPAARTRSTAWTRPTARSWPCGTSSS